MTKLNECIEKTKELNNYMLSLIRDWNPTPYELTRILDGFRFLKPEEALAEQAKLMTKITRTEEALRLSFALTKLSALLEFDDYVKYSSEYSLLQNELSIEVSKEMSKKFLSAYNPGLSFGAETDDEQYN